MLEGEPNSKMWVSKETGLPLKIEEKFEADSKGLGELVIVTRYEYDKETKIEAPALNQ